MSWLTNLVVAVTILVATGVIHPPKVQPNISTGGVVTTKK